MANKQKQVITLFELERMLEDKFKEETGKIKVREHPMELAPAYASYCRRHWGAWEIQKEKRILQLHELGIADTHEIDYYINQISIRPL